MEKFNTYIFNRILDLTQKNLFHLRDFGLATVQCISFLMLWSSTYMVVYVLYEGSVFKIIHKWAYLN